MKKKLSILALSIGLFSNQLMAEDILTGDVRLACEALLCLSTPHKPGECTPSVARYFSIVKKKPSQTVKARINFLKKCPASDESDEMRHLVESLGSGAGICDAKSLNRSLALGKNADDKPVISSKLPSNCQSYYASNTLKDQKPKYVYIVNKFAKSDSSGKIKWIYPEGAKQLADGRWYLEKQPINFKSQGMWIDSDENNQE